MGFIYEGRDKTQRTGHEKIAMRNIRNAFNWIIGGYYNAMLDGELDAPKLREDLADEIYDSAIEDSFGDGWMGIGGSPREMRFAGEKFCRAYIEWKLDNDEDAQAIMNIK